MKRPLLVSASVAWLTSLAAFGEVPPRSAGLQTLTPTAAHLDAGDVYYLEPGADTQLTFISDARLLGLTVTTRRAVGYIICPFEDQREGRNPILAGEFRLPVASLTAGGADIDGPLHSPAFLNAAEHPEITLSIRETRDLAPLEGDQAGGVRLTLVGELTVKGKAIAIEWPAEFRFAPFVWAQMGRGIGDLATLRFTGRFKLADAGLTIPQEFGQRLAPEIEVRAALTFTTITPDKTLDPSITQDDNARLLAVGSWLRDFRDRRRGYAAARELETLWADNADRLHRLARLVIEETGEQRDPAFALRVAKKAAALDGGKTIDVLVTLALAHHRAGDLEQAVQAAKQAAALASGGPPPVAAAINGMLAEMEADMK